MTGPRLPSQRRGLDVECWCQSGVVRVSADDVYAGLTDSCGLDACDRIDRRERRAARERVVDRPENSPNEVDG